MVADAGLVNHGDRRFQLSHFSFENSGILCHWDYVVGVSHYMQYGNTGLRNACGVIQRISFPVGRFFFTVEAVSLQHPFDVLFRTGICSFPIGQLLMSITGASA